MNTDQSRALRATIRTYASIAATSSDSAIAASAAVVAVRASRHLQDMLTEMLSQVRIDIRSGKGGRTAYRYGSDF